LKTAVYNPFWRYWVPPIIWTLAIVVLSGNLGSPNHTLSVFKWVVSWIITLDHDTLSTAHFYFRKFLHVMYYGALTLLWFRALMSSCPERAGANRLLALVICLAVALSDEGRQYLVPSRTSNWWDIGLDMSGGLLFLFLGSRFYRNRVMAPSEAQPSSPDPSGLQSQKRRFILKK
jgi:VanZ family protein